MLIKGTGKKTGENAVYHLHFAALKHCSFESIINLGGEKQTNPRQQPNSNQNQKHQKTMRNE